MSNTTGSLPETVLWQGVLTRQQYGELTAEVTFPQPVLVTAVTVVDNSAAKEFQLPQLFKGYARDLSVPTSARFLPLFSSVIASFHQPEEHAVEKVFPTQHVSIRGRCSNATVQLLGYTLGDAAQRIKDTAEARFCPLPAVSTVLSFPSTQQQSDEVLTALRSDTAPSLARPAGRLLPLRKIPPSFVLALAPLATYWEGVRKIPLPPGSPEPAESDLTACEQLALAVLAAHRGSPAMLTDKLSSHVNPYGLAVDWDSIRDSVLDMATYCCSALADTWVNHPMDLSLATTGVFAAIMLAACQDSAAQFLSWPNGNAGVAGAIAVKELLSIPHQPQPWQSLSLGLVDLLLESCPAIACPTLQGTLDPAGVSEPEDSDMACQGGTSSPQHSPASTPGSPAAEAGVEPAAHDQQAEDGGCRSAGGSVQGAAGPDAQDVDAGLPAPKRQRVSEAGAATANLPSRHQVVPDASGGRDGPNAATDRQLVHACSVTENAAVAMAWGDEELRAQQQSRSPFAAATEGPGDDLVGHADRPSVSAADASDDVDAAAMGGRRSNRRRSSSDDGLGQLLDPDEKPETAGDYAEDGFGGVQQQDVSDAAHQEQDVALQEGDYPEADEDAIRAEAAAKASRRGVERQRQPVQALARGQLYAAVAQLALSPLQQGAAVSCRSVLRRLRAYNCLDVLQSTIAPMLAGQVNALLLQPPEFCDHVSRVAAAASDLAALVLQPAGSRHSLMLHDQQELHVNSAWQQQPEADFCVLQLMLSFRALDLLAAFCGWLGVHMSRLDNQLHLSKDDAAEKQQQDGAQVQPHAGLQDRTQRDQPQQPAGGQEQGSAHLLLLQAQQLCHERAHLLGAIRALTASLTGCAGGWCFLSAARDGLAALAAAVCPSRQVLLDGGPFQPDTSAPYDPEHGWQAERQQLLQSATGLRGVPQISQLGQALDTEEVSAAAAAASDLADSLQRLWLLGQAVRQLECAEDVLSGKNQADDAAEKLNAAMKTLYVGGFASDIGQQLLVCALSASPAAVRQLGVLLGHYGKVQVAAANGEDCRGGVQQHQHKPKDASHGERLVYGALYAPEILWAVVSSPHADSLAAWLPHTKYLHKVVQEQLNEYELYGAVAAKAAFPDILDTKWDVLQRSGLPSAVIPGGAAAAEENCQRVLLQLHGAVLTAQKLQEGWAQNKEASCAGTGRVLLDWLQIQLPDLVPQQKEASTAGQPQVEAPIVPRPATAASVAAAAADAMSRSEGESTAAGLPAPGAKAVKADAVVEFMRNAACRSAALCALHLIHMLLRGAPASIRTMARCAAAGKRKHARAVLQALNNSVLLNADGSLGPNGPQDYMDMHSQAIDAPLLTDGLAPREFVSELLLSEVLDSSKKNMKTIMVLEVLDVALRTATVALQASDGDLTRAVQGGVQQDLLVVLQASTAAAALMRAACTTTAALLLQLTEANVKQLGRHNVSACSLLDALICAHSTIVSCKEGLQACVPHPVLGPLVAKAADPALNPVQRLTADAAVASASVRCAGGRVAMLLEARQALAVCLRCWQLQGWWPDPVGALLGYFPKATALTEQYALEAAAARRAGDPSAPPAPAPRQGPRQQLSALLGLADLCPEEWPPRGASQVAAQQRDAAHSDKPPDGSPFVCPSLVMLRKSVAGSLAAHWERLDQLITFGSSCRTRLARSALTRMLARMAGLGGGMSTMLAPQVLLGLCSHLHVIQRGCKGLADRLLGIKAVDATEVERQHLLDAEINTLLLQLQGAVQVTEVLLPLCGAPSIKSVLTEYKAAGVLSKAVYGIVRPLPDLAALQTEEAGSRKQQGAAGPQPVVGPGLQRLSAESQALAGLLLQLVKVLWDPDISLDPWADRSARELQDTPSIMTGSISCAWLLLAAAHLSTANMAALADLLVGAGHPPGGSCLRSYPKGRAVLLCTGRQWQLLKQAVQEADEREVHRRMGGVMPLPQQPQGDVGADITLEELQAAAQCLAGTLDSCQHAGGPDTAHAASCAAIAAVLRQLAGSDHQEYDAVKQAEQQQASLDTCERFVTAAKAAAAAAAAVQQPESQDSQAISTMLCSPPLLLACDAATLDFWKVSAASAERALACPPPQTHYPHNAALATDCASSWWPSPQLVEVSQAGAVSLPIQQVMAVAKAEQQRRQARLAAGAGAAQDEVDAGGPVIPAIMAPRSNQFQFLHSDSTCGRHQSLHVDEFVKRVAQKAPPKKKRGARPPGPPSSSALGGAGGSKGGGGPEPYGPPRGSLRPPSMAGGPLSGRLGSGPLSGQQQSFPPSSPPWGQAGMRAAPPSDPRLRLLNLQRQGSSGREHQPSISPRDPLSPTAASRAGPMHRADPPRGTPPGATAAPAAGVVASPPSVEVMLDLLDQDSPLGGDLVEDWPDIPDEAVADAAVGGGAEEEEYAVTEAGGF